MASVSHSQHATRESLLPILRVVPPPVIIGCPHPGCRYAASAISEGRAVRSLARHLVKVHWVRRAA